MKMSIFEFGLPPRCELELPSPRGAPYPYWFTSLPQTKFMTDFVLSIQSGMWFLGFRSRSEGASRVLRTQWMQKFV
jgi:hypothetical protein